RGTVPLLCGLRYHETACANRAGVRQQSPSAQNRDNLGGLEDGDIAHDLGDRNVVNPNEFRFKNRLAVLKEHREYFTKIGVQLVERGALRVSTGEARDEPDEETGLWVALDYSGVCFHGFSSRKANG